MDKQIAQIENDLFEIYLAHLAFCNGGYCEVCEDLKVEVDPLGGDTIEDYR